MGPIGRIGGLESARLQAWLAASCRPAGQVVLSDLRVRLWPYRKDWWSEILEAAGLAGWQLLARVLAGTRECECVAI